MKQEWAPEFVDRTLGMITSVGGVLLLLLALPLVYTPQASAFASWWNLAAFAWAAIMVILALTGWFLPLHVLRPAWALHCVWFLLLLLVSFAAARPASGARPLPFDDLTPWVWAAAAAPATLLVLVTTLRNALIGTVLMAALPALSALLFRGAVPTAVLSMTPIALGIGIGVVMYAPLRARLAQVYRAEVVARLRTQLERRGYATAVEQGEFARAVHDRVLSTLTAASHIGGTPSPALRDEAERALAVLEDDVDPLPPIRLRAEAVAVLLEAEVGRLAPDATLRMSTARGSYPSTVVAPINAALGEAVRNALRHAGPASGITVTISADQALTVTVADSGGGFDAAATAPERLGVRDSILARMHDLDGGVAEIRSGPAGTIVELRWAP